MARRPQDPTPSSHDHDDPLADARRALTDATTALTRLLGRQVGSIGDEVGQAVAEGLREATRGLAEASEAVRSQTTTADGRRRERVDRTRNDLLDAMARLTARRGYEGAAVADIASEAGYTKGALYANFGSKEDLFLTLALRESSRGRLLGPQPSDDDVGPGVAAGVDGSGTTPEQDAALLALEVLAYAVRHPASLDDLRPVVHDDLERIAAQARDARVAQAGAGFGAPVEAVDRETAVALVAVRLVAPLLGCVDGDATLGTGLTDRLVARVLGGPGES